MRGIRSFICIEIPEEIKARIAALQAALRRLPVEVSWTRPENVHLTVKFLGEVEEAKIPTLGALLSDLVGAYAPFELVTDRVGAFPTLERPRVLWIGVRDERGVLRALVADVEEALAAHGFAKEARPFTAHLTLGRLRSDRSARELIRRFVAEGFPAARFLVTRVLLMRSDLRPEGALYTPLSVALLRGRS